MAAILAEATAAICGPPDVAAILRRLETGAHLIAMNLDLPDCRTLAGAGQGNEAVTYAMKARYELEAELRKLADPRT